ncbi:methylated-DNA-[protein]-cysteine S-methyltransferase [Alicyclobacillus sacchari]|uniref:methylated-DNA--[protein]-cysteine S-methyltransferase n=1 Tax=Alicyclobacillus sacchari TaxID=392010 RepID=A0A4R8LKD3_9BACL|nr:methylated-DNA-[protein]-cysteine S-methyltransferase [Alicyclobacillus sacchari]
MDGQSVRVIATQFGPFAVVTDDETVVEATWLRAEHEVDRLKENRDGSRLSARLADRAIEEVQAYFRGELTAFTVPVRAHGTRFQKAVWQALCAIPYGETATYGEIAERIGRPAAVRAVGQANRANPVAVIVPCHRVVGKGSVLRGYAGAAVDIQEGLLALEQGLLLLLPEMFDLIRE